MTSNNNTHKDALKRFIDGFYTKEDVANLFFPTTSDQTKHDFASEMDQVWNETELFGLTESDAQVYKCEAQELLKRIQRKKLRFYIAPLIKYAAIVLFIVSTSLAVYYYADQFISQNIRYTEIMIGNGEKKQIELPDGTKVMLNSGSYLKYPNRFVGNDRKVEIDGEAFFNVTHDKSKPFIIKAEGANIKVLGTSFNVKAYKKDELLSVSVKTGKVQVDMHEAMMRLNPNEQVILNKQSGEFSKRIEKIDQATAWMKGELYFDKTPIKSVVRELCRIYNCEIILEPGIKFDDYIYGEHDNKNLKSVLESIQFATGIKYRDENGKIILYK